MFLSRSISRKISGVESAALKSHKGFALRCILLMTSIVLAAGLSSCARQSGITKTLTDVESLIDERPDSALAVLQQLDPADLSGRKAKARFALLMTMAKYKNYINEADDSLIRVAVDYYAGKHGDGNVKYKFLSLYHWGNVLSCAGSRPQAMIEYSEAEKLLDRLDDDYLAGLLYVSKGALYRVYCNYPKALEYYQTAYGHYEKAGKAAHAAYCLFDTGLMYWNSLDYEKGEKYLRLAYKHATELNDEYLGGKCLENLVILYDALNEYDKESAVIDSLQHSYGLDRASSSCLNSIANIFILKNKPDSARFYSDRAWEKAGSTTDSISLLFQPVEILKRLNRKSEAFDNLEKGYAIQSRVLREFLQQPLLTAQNEYFRGQAELNAYRLKKGRQLYLILGLASVLLIMAIFMYFRWRITEKDRQLAGYVDLAESLRKAVDEKDRKLSDIEVQKNVLSTRVNEMSGQVASLFSGQYKLFDKLINICYESSSSNREKEAVYDQISSEIDRFSKDRKVIAELEKIINKYKNNVILYIKSEIPNISDRDLRLLCYIYAGFSVKSITVFTKETISNILTRKHRLKIKIRKLNPPHAKLMIDAMQ